MGETLASTLTAITTVMTSLFAGVGDVIDVVTATPLLFIAVAIPIVGAVIGFTKRFFSI